MTEEPAEPAAPSLHELRCRQITDTYATIEDMLSADGRTPPPDVIATLAGIALRLVLVRP